jgi:hypothetical protein
MALLSDLHVEAATSEADVLSQLSGLLGDKAMATEELNLQYMYRYGCSIETALKCPGYDRRRQEFFDDQKLFRLHDGLISLRNPAPEVVAKKIEEHDRLNNCMKGADEETASVTGTESTDVAEGGWASDTDSDVDVSGWLSLGNRLAAALNFPSDEESDDEAISWNTRDRHVACRTAEVSS